MSVAGRRSPPKKASQMPKVVNLALQGGGSHGAFTWGVLDRLLEEERLSFEGISATSAGAVNAVVLADAWPPAAARERGTHCEIYWQKVSALSARGIFKPSSVDKGNSDFGLEHSLGFWFLKMTYLTSPYQMNPFNHNPLKELLAEAINFERVRGQTALKLFLCATNVQTAKVKIFTGKELRVELVLFLAGAGFAHLLAPHELLKITPDWGVVRFGNDLRNRIRRASLRRRSPHAIASVLGWHRVGDIFALRLASQFQTCA
jgi:predicted acylesterase/phospholipase RssA